MTRITHAIDEKPGISPVNRSLERGIELLRAFRAGSELLGNAELAERTGLARSTVSRLTQTLVGSGMLQIEHRAYRLAPAVLGLAHAMRSGSTVLAVAASKMRALAEANRINVGLAAPDRDEMVYLESIRYNRRVSLRSVVSGQRVPMELTSLGRAHLATLPDEQRDRLYSVFKQRRGKQWPALRDEIERAIVMVGRHGFCAASWQPEVVALAAPVRANKSDGPDGAAHYVLNLSVSTSESMASVVRDLSPALLALVRDVERTIARGPV
ncbi:helix-turn-helix domain-containing protein [Variovorax sp. J22P271]|uniref:IclR family transcriptional regulator n=1 Tax=Variovorax davisae TaxID=3053515 RepID=UPI00257690DB|nr:helix-turn-helix domain-containing protein [Variovorax sp. J22P271]MDM0032018.1 helix-turn-helix domain-containing protein [Variovorax sp. J22P271]